MYNLKEGKGTYKGLIGECLFKLTKKYLIVTKFFNKRKYFDTFGKNLLEQEKEFIEKNWFTIDALEFDYSEKHRKVIIYEIKTRNKYDAPKPNWKNKMTLSSCNIYNEALRLGFKVKLVTVWLHNDWDYDIETEDFESATYSIDKPKKYDKGP